jgi:cAMP-dependent protein kinase regulator
MRELPINIALLRRIPIFANLSDAQLKGILSSPNNKVVDYGPMEEILHEGDVADCMYIILDGMVDVRIKAVAGREITIATLKTGEYFGEQALLPGSTGRRNASVRSLQSARVYRIAKDDVVLGYSTEGAVGPSEDEELLPLDELDINRLSDEERIRRMLRANRLFRTLTDSDLANVRAWARTGQYEAGEVIIREGETGDSMYIVLDGSVEVFIVDDEGKVLLLATLQRGQYFGELAMIPTGPGRHNANVRAATRTKLIEVNKDIFRQMLRRDDKLLIALQTVADAQRKKIAELLGRSTEL